MLLLKVRKGHLCNVYYNLLMGWGFSKYM